MTSQHLITPPPELVQQIALQAIDTIPDNEYGAVEIDEAREKYIANFFAQWAADQELEACCVWLEGQTFCGHRDLIPSLRAARRPKPPSMKEQALSDLDVMTTVPPGMSPLAPETVERIERIRRALEALPE